MNLEDLLSQWKYHRIMEEYRCSNSQLTSRKQWHNQLIEMKRRTLLRTKDYQTWFKTIKVKIRSSVKKYKNFNRNSHKPILHLLPDKQHQEQIHLQDQRQGQQREFNHRINQEPDYHLQIQVPKDLVMWQPRSTAKWEKVVESEKRIGWIEYIKLNFKKVNQANRSCFNSLSDRLDSLKREPFDLLDLKSLTFFDY